MGEMEYHGILANFNPHNFFGGGGSPKKFYNQLWIFMFRAPCPDPEG